MNKKLVSLLSQVFPGLLANYAYSQVTRPQVRKLRERELRVLDQAEKSDRAFGDFTIKTYHWQGRGRKVLLIHGWEGQAGNFASLVPALTQAGFDVYAFDAPSHGFSSSGKTSLFEFIDLVQELIQEYELHYLISHSFGGVATTYALSQLPDFPIKKYLLITTPDRFLQRINSVAEMTGIGEKVKQLLIERIYKETGMDPETMNVSDIVKQVNVEEALIIHDKNDRVIPLSQSEAVHTNWPASSLEVVEGTGHFRILGDEAVINRAIEFLSS